MSKNDREFAYYFRLARVAAPYALLGMLCLYAIADVSWTLAYNAAKADRYTDYYSAQTPKVIQERCFLPGIVTAECIREIIITSRENQRAEADLDAQIDMARWALWVVIVTGATLLVTAVGVWYVRDTLLETRRIGQAQVRAYVSWDGANVSPRGSPSDNGILIHDFSLVPKIKNTGQSPATLTAMYADIIELDPSTPPDVTFDLVEAACGNEIGAGGSFEFRRQITSLETANNNFYGEKRYCLIGWAGYTDVFQVSNSGPHVTHFCFEINFVGEPSHLTTGALLSANMEFRSIPNYSIRPA